MAVIQTTRILALIFQIPEQVRSINALGVAVRVMSGVVVARLPAMMEVVIRSVHIVDHMEKLEVA